MVDAQTANLLCQIHDSIKFEKNREKFRTMEITTATKFAWKFVNR